MTSTSRRLLPIAAAIIGLSGPSASASTPGAAGPFLPGPPIVEGFAPRPDAERTPRLLRRGPDREAALAATQPEAVEYYARTYGVPEKTARERLAAQGMAANLSVALGSSPGSGYVDHWWDNASGQLVVLVDQNGDLKETRSFLVGRGLTASEFRLERASYSRDDLEAAYVRLGDELEEVPTGQAAVGVARGEVRVTWARSASGSARARLETAAKTPAGNVAVPVRTVNSTVESLSPEATTCFNAGVSFPRSCDEIVGGQPYFNRVNPSAGTWARCTLGYFVGWRGRSPWVPSMITAGHCLNSEPLVAQQSACRPWQGYPCEGIGLSLQYFFGHGRADAGMIDLYAHNWRILGGWWNWDPGTWTPSQSNYYFWGAPGAGYVVCKNGSTSGSTCGTISVPWEDVPIGGVLQTGLTRTANLRTCKGDSGGPVTSASIPAAVGLNSGAIMDSDWNGSQLTCGNVTQWHTPVWQPLHYFNLDMYGGGPFGPYA